MKGYYLGLLAVGTLFGGTLSAEETITVTQREWADYFPNMPRQEQVYEPEFDRVDMSYVTPHTPWAKPYYAGKIRALILAVRVAHRDTVELAQRLEMDFDVINAFSRSKLGGTEAGRYDVPVACSEAEQRLKLDEFLKKDYDVMIIGKMNADAVPKELQDKIRDKVKAGMGLVISHISADEKAAAPSWVLGAKECLPEEAEQICAGLPFAVLDGWDEYKTAKEASAKMVKCRTLGKGRIVTFRISAAPKSRFCGYLVPAPAKFREEIKLWPVDYYISLAARAVTWASGCPPDGKAEISVNKDSLAVKIDGLKDRWDEIELKARDAWGAEVYRRSGKELTYPLPDMAGGEYVADAIIRKGGKTLNWASTVFKIEKDNQIKSLEAVPKGVKPGEEYAAGVKLAGNIKEPCVLEIQVLDMQGRLINQAKEELAVGRDSAEAKWRMDDPLSNLVRIRATLLAGGKIQSRAETYLPVNQPYPRDDFGFVCWDLMSPEYSMYYARAELVKLGVDSFYGARRYSQAWVPATAGFHPIPYMTRYAISRTTPGPRYERVPCLSDPEYIKNEQEKIRKCAEETSMFGPAGYSLGDENDLSLNDHEVCFSPHCREAFREYVKKIYGGKLEAVNAEWGMTNTSWATLEPAPLWEAQAKKQPARWVDFRMSMEDVFVKIHQMGAETVKAVDKDGLVGFDGGFDITSFTGYDWWKLSRILDIWGTYPDHLQAEILRSFHRPTARTGRWYGGYITITRFNEFAQWEPWYDLFHEMNNAWWFNIIGGDDGGPQAEDTMNPASFKPFPILASTAAEIREIKAGIGKLLLGCRRDADGVAILYSQASLHAATFYGLGHKPPDSQLDFVRMLEDLGYSYRFVSYDQVKEEILEKENWRLLVLPCAVALSAAEREQIRKFAAKGGRILADDIPGIYDEHGKEADDPAWRALIDNEVKMIGGTIRNYRRNASCGNAMRQYMLEALQGMGIEPEIKLKTGKSEVYGGELAVFKDGKATYLGLLRDHTPAQVVQKAEIILSQPGFIYDMRHGKCLGNSNVIKTDLKAGQAGLWGVLPDKAGELRLVAKSEATPGAKVPYNIAVGDAYRHVVRIDVVDGKGNPRPEYGQNLECRNGKAEGILPLALNDARGIWTITARDIVSGSIYRHKLIVK